MSLFDIDRETCEQDGICAAVCPAGIIDFEKGRIPVPAAEAEEICISCGHCVAACPTGSLSHRDIALDRCPPINEELRLSEAQFEHFLRSRRSIRNYKKKSIPREDISRLIRVASHAPSGHNCQCAQWLVFDSRDDLRKLSGVVVEWFGWMLENMPGFAGEMHLDRAIQRWKDGRDVVLRGAPAVIVAHAEKENALAPSTCTIALTHLELFAKSMGLGCCWAGYFAAAASTFPPMLKALSLPEGHMCFGAMMVGYPKFDYFRLPLRSQPAVAWR